ncbi:olfactory receptor 23 [Bombyx mori]|uniref:Olfactory receptor n=1 Tax=Bombyx mori TaxID=7091 RepID=C4B7V4_BOMMO|nr:olfactory receptor 23 [Bombyx mori]BAH66320.1 olfactory receptor [Bombyx mori]
MRAKTEFEKTIKLTKTALFLSGINIFLGEWNHWTRTFVDSIAYYLNIVGLYFVLIGEMYWLIDGTITGKSFVELSLIVPCLTISVLATAKVHYLYHNKESLLDVVDKLREIYPDEIEETANDNDQCLNDKKETVYDNDVTEVGIVNEANELLKFVNFLLSTVSFVVTMTFCTMPLFGMAGEFMETGKFVVLYPFAVKYPFDVYNTSFWVIVYVNQFWATIIVCTNIFGVDTLFYALCSYIGMNFRLLSYKFEHLEIKRNDRIINEIIVLIKRHQELIELVNKTQSLYSLSTLFNIVTSSLLICLSGFNITILSRSWSYFALLKTIYS